MRGRRGENGSKLFIFLFWLKTTKFQKENLKRKHQNLQAVDRLAWKMCVSVSALIGGKVFFPPRTIFHCCTSIDEQKITCYTSKAFQHLTVTKLAAGLWLRPMFIKGAFVTSPMQIIETDWENHKDISRSLSTFVNSGQPVTRLFCQHGTDEAGGGRSDSLRSNYVFFSLLCFFFAHSNHISVFLFAFWGLIHLFTAQGVYSPLWPYCVGHMTHADWTRCQSQSKPFVIFSLHHAQFMSPSRHLNESGGKKKKGAHNAVFTDTASPQDSGTSTRFENNTDESLSAS